MSPGTIPITETEAIVRRLLPALLTALSITLTTTGAANADRDLEYVALGDSAAAGPLIPDRELLHAGCLRSTGNWPSILAARIEATTFRDVTCSSAVTDNLTAPQPTLGGRQAPQLDAVTPSTDLVTLTIGGNDVNLVGTAASCINPLPEPLGLSCRDRLTAGGRDQLAEQIDAYAPEFAAALDAISAKAPEARIVVVGYGTYVKPGGCHPKQPIWARDADYLQANIHRLNALFAREAEAHGATFVDIAPPSVGHDVCAPPDVKWFEGVIPTSQAAPLHPNAKGMEGIGEFVADSIG
ncbi:lysophospholipase L1-like esterase [Saccharothrix tamanrassetensis]|uniref:Lysophospholipase L1-like esterase n=1 Tax=Saccharothrix tamanrassetensis TaxID=1051531 RepID=A0A841CLA4_9PSEU|nr:SGNH/GDSL hydrolase family protein [Saccharothrix tamanrassetensis]MBB5957870.1 lysophospholipase L1-like esterase [Saccharothrix tamanrassetensis]